MKVQVIGLGGIGKNLLKTINQKNGLIKSKLGEKIEIVSVSDTSGTVITDGMPLLRIIQAKESGGLKEIESFEKMSALKAIKDIDSDLVVELTQSTLDGSPGLNHVIAAMENEKDVVTANKGVLTTGINMFEKVKEYGRKMRYEATVCGSIPVFSLMDYSIQPASIISISGFFNATSSFIASKMGEGMSREAAIDQAIKIGLAEKNYRDDIEGIDSARKSIILHRRVFGSSISMKDVQFKNIKEGLVPGNRLFSEITESGIQIGYIHVDRMNGNKNGIEAPMSINFKTDIFDSLSLTVDHDGPVESAAAVLNDIMLIAKEKMMKQ
ncbi:MAG: hypothetical protein ACP5MU_02135 [Thermoplasmata archaeon]